MKQIEIKFEIENKFETNMNQIWLLKLKLKRELFFNYKYFKSRGYITALIAVISYRELRPYLAKSNKDIGDMRKSGQDFSEIWS